MIFATTEVAYFWQILSSLSMGGCLFLLTVTILKIISISTNRAVHDSDKSFEEKQFSILRNENPLFRYAEAFISELTSYINHSPRINAVEHHLTIINLAPPWNAEIYMATKLLEGILLSTGVALFAMLFMNFFAALFFSMLIFFIYYQISLASLKKSAEKRKRDIKLRLPFVVDLMALTRGAGASFGESLTVAARENSDHPAGEVFAKTLHDFTYGTDQKTVMEELANRMQDADFQEMVFAINKADELGTLIAKTLAELAVQMRLKRQQWGEKVSNEAQVKILFPGMIIMVACMLIIIFPFILLAIYGNVAMF